MLSPISAAIHKLLRIEPQQLKAEQNKLPPNQVGLLPKPQHQQSNSSSIILPQAQWQVVRLLAAVSNSSGLSQDLVYLSQLQQSQSFKVAGGQGELQLRFHLDGQPHQMRWQINQGEALLLVSTLPAAYSLKLIPTLDQGWRIVADGFLHSEPLQLLWSPVSTTERSRATGLKLTSLYLWIRTMLITVLIL
ncbi:hypothetical protein L4D09_20915, partial [Photobacterium makurazakiensis]|uniref:hypothetical protein n=1 Tax=Photobacterium makurazakiensis TaxID=2910234 RepID=UPI003D1253A1